MQVRILEEKIPNKSADLFYDTPYEATSKDGITFYVQFEGEVQFDFKGGTYYANTLSDLFDDPDFNDDSISNMEFESNGWLEIHSEQNTQELMDFLDDRNVEGDYDGGLEMLKRICIEWEERT